MALNTLNMILYIDQSDLSPTCEHLQKPHNAGSRPGARFFNTLLMPEVTMIVPQW
jgi:hypothetical protein